jgi:hypothetical protein
MKCATCGAKAMIRKGPHGEFYCCPNSKPGDNHGTRSVAVQQQLEKLVWRDNDAAPPPAPDLELIVRTKMVSLFGIHMSETEMFVEGDWRDADIFDDGPYDDSDHWSNIRPY